MRGEAMGREAEFRGQLRSQTGVWERGAIVVGPELAKTIGPVFLFADFPWTSSNRGLDSQL